MSHKIIWLRIAYWWGIIADAVMAVLMLFPTLFIRVMNLNFRPEAGFGYGLINAAPLMIGWTILLFWANRKPIERRAVLPLTLPVVVGYFLVEIYAIVTGLSTLGQMLPLFVSQTCMSAVFIFSYLNAQPASEP